MVSEVTRAAALVVGMSRKCIASEHRNSLMDDRSTWRGGGGVRGAVARRVVGLMNNMLPGWKEGQHAGDTQRPGTENKRMGSFESLNGTINTRMDAPRT